MLYTCFSTKELQYRNAQNAHTRSVSTHKTTCQMLSAGACQVKGCKWRMARLNLPREPISNYQSSPKSHRVFDMLQKWQYLKDLHPKKSHRGSRKPHPNRRRSSQIRVSETTTIPMKRRSAYNDLLSQCKAIWETYIQSNESRIKLPIPRTSPESPPACIGKKTCHGPLPFYQRGTESGIAERPAQRLSPSMAT